MLKINGTLFGNEEFHNGEVIYKDVPLKNDRNIIEMCFENNKDITNLLMGVLWIRKEKPSCIIELLMEYIPYSRMDRKINEQIFSLDIFAALINSCNFNKVYVLDPHSQVSLKSIKNIECLPLYSKVIMVKELFNPDYIFYPDKGAYEKYPVILGGLGVEYFYGTKVRDLSNKGKLIEESYELHNTPDLKNKKVLIVDDLVSMGGTALLAAKTLKRHGAKEVALYVSHCENGIFAGQLLKRQPIKKSGGDNEPWDGGYIIDKVYTAATTPLESAHENLIIIK